VDYPDSTDYTDGSSASRRSHTANKFPTRQALAEKSQKKADSATGQHRWTQIFLKMGLLSLSAFHLCQSVAY
jgi:hypothetical protein